MRLDERQINRLAEQLLDALLLNGAARLTGDRGRAILAITEVVQRLRRQLAELDRDARSLLDKHLAAAPAGLDAQKVLQMIKKKLAEERGVPL